MLNCRPLVAALIIVIVGGLADVAAHAEDKEPPSASPLRKLQDESLAWDELFLDEQATQPLETRVVLRWSNSSRGSETGMTVLYLADGMPFAVNCVYPWEGHLNHEFESCSRRTFVAKQEGRVFWQPESAGIKPRAIPGAPVPAASPVARLRQMKALSNEFASTMLGWKSDSTDREVLRLLPQPLYRYEPKTGEVVDGAVFAFVQGTDPESLLLIEAVRKKEGALEWQFAFVRRTSGELEGRHKDVVVWHADRFPANTDPRATHFVIGYPLSPEVIESLQKAEK